MRRKGYNTESSDFYGRQCENQTVDGYFCVDRKTREQLMKVGVIIEESDNGYTSITFRPEEAAIESMKQMWNYIADILPDKEIPSQIAHSLGSQRFRDKYGDPHQVEKVILENRLATGQYHQAEKANILHRLTVLNELLVDNK